MRVESCNPGDRVSFQYKHPLKTMYLRGQLPTVKYGIYGKRLTKKTVSLEHLTPHSLGGTTTYDDLALADKKANNIRGNSPLADFLSVKTAKKYLKQFKNVVVGNFNGNEYIQKIIKTLHINHVDIKDV